MPNLYLFSKLLPVVFDYLSELPEHRNMKRVTFKKLSSNRNEAEIIAQLREHLITKVHASDYNTDMVCKVVRMLIRRYKTADATEDFGKHVYMDMVSKRYKANYIKNVMSAIEYWAESQKNTIRLPRPKRYDNSIKFLKPNEARRLLESADNIRDAGLLAVLLYGGLRNREVVNLNVEDYNSQDRILWIRDNTDDDIKYHGVKNDKEDFVTLPPEAHKLLSAYIRERPIVKTRAMFVTRDSKRFSARGIDDLIRRTAERAGIEAIGCHCLRHTMVTLALAANVNMHFVQRQARHSSSLITEKYAHAAQDLGLLRKAFDDGAKAMF